MVYESCQLHTLSESSYTSPHRMYKRAYYDSAERAFVLPFKKYEAIQIIKLTNNFIFNVIFHIEAALENNYADYINFSDMGHSHFLVPKAYYEKEISPMATQNMAEQIEKILSFEETKFLYHTAEQLQIVQRADDQIILPDDEYLKHRYLTRNIIGDNKRSKKLEIVQVKDLKKEYNTVRDVEGYQWLGFIYFIHANHKGCFPFKKDGNIQYFDINLIGPLNEEKDTDLPYI